MKKGIAFFIVMTMLFQGMFFIGSVYGEDIPRIEWTGEILKNEEVITTLRDNMDFTIKIKVIPFDSTVKKVRLSFESSPSFVLTSYTSGNERVKEIETNKFVPINLYYLGGDSNLSLEAKDIDDDSVIANLEIHIQTTSYSDSSSGGTRKTPALIIPGGGSLPVVNGGEEAKISIPIENIGSKTARNIQVVMELDENTPFEMEKLNVTYTIDRINAKKSDSALFTLKVSDNAEEKTYPINLYYYLDGSENKNDLGTIYVKVQNSKKPPKLILSAVGYGDTPLVAGEKHTVSVVIRNNGTLDAKDVRVSLKGLRTDGFTLFKSPDVKQLSNIGGNKVMQIDYILIPSISMGTGNYDLGLKIDYKDSKNTSYSEETSFFLPVKGLDTTLSDIVIENIDIPDGEIKAEESFKIAFDVVNKSSIEADEVRVSLNTEKDIICKSLNINTIGKLPKDEPKRVEFELYATTDAVTRNYPIQINVDYENGVGEKKVKNNITQYVGVYVNRGSGRGTPRIIVDRYNIEPSTIKAGDNFQLTMSLLNTSSSSTVSNIKVSLVSDDGVFNPVNSSNTIYIESIGPKENIQKVFTLAPKRDAEHKTYGISVNIDYEDDKGTQYNSKDMISVPVIQQVKLVLGDLVTPPEVYLGQPFPVSIEFFNMGKTILYNLMIKTEGNFSTQNSNYYVGNFEPGKTDSYDVGITSEQEGLLNGKIIFSFENAVGEPYEVIKEFEVNSIQMPMEPMPEPGMDENPEAGGPKEKFMRIIKKPYVIGGLIALIFGVIVTVRKVHKKKREMTLDE